MYSSNRMNRSPEPIRTTDSTDSVVILLKDAINELASLKIFHSTLALECHEMGLQGDKRKHRYEGRKLMMLMEYIQHYVLDIFKEKLQPDWDFTPCVVNDTKEYLKCYEETMQQSYKSLCDISNKLIIVGYRKEGEIVACEIECLIKQIEECHRRWKDFEKSEWSWHHITRYDKCIHDEYEKKEESQGYCDR